MNVEAFSARSLHLTWTALLLATLLGFGTAGHFGHPLLAAAAIMIIAGVKAVLILRNFMELNNGPVAFRAFFTLWVVACVAAITSLFACVRGH